MNVVVSGFGLLRGKPHPDVYQDACAALGLDPGRAAALEDSRSGVIAAKAAGMTAIAYRNPSSGAQDLSAADRIVDDIAVLTPGGIAE